jgi:hypothetical protein
MPKILTVCLFIPVSIPALAQNNEIGLLLGGMITPRPSTLNQGGSVPATLSINSGLAFQAIYTHFYGGNNWARPGLEVAFIASPLQDVISASPSASRNYASIFITPGIHVRFVPKSALSPWASVGGGYARFTESTTLRSGQPNPFQPGVNKGALQYGGGVDFKTSLHLLIPIVLRAEVRDFYTGQPRLNVQRSGSGQHNVVVSGGIVLRF